MPTTTTNLGLNKTDTTSDGQGSFVDKNEYFNFDTDLNDNWDIIDTIIGALSNLTTTEKTNLVGAINEVISAKLNKSGDTMTGTLEFDKSVNPVLRTNLNHTVRSDNLPAENIWTRTELMYDNEDKLLYSERLRISTEGTLSRYLTVHNYDAQSEDHIAEVGLHCYADGSASFGFPKCDTKPTTTSSAATNLVIVGTKNYLNEEAGYVKYSDGLIIQWGKTAEGASQEVTLLQSYSNANYFVGTTQYYSNSVAADYGAIMSKTKAKFTMKGYSTVSFGWFAIGY